MAIRIDKSLFSAEELEQYQALIAKATVMAEEEEYIPEPEPAPKKPPFIPVEEPEEDEMEKGCGGVDKACGMKKGVDPVIQKALADLEELKKSAEMRELASVAKKYAPLGKNETELTDTLYAMKKSSPENYDAYIQVLDESLGIVNKSGLFAEIGKSAGGEPGTIEGRINAAATAIQKSDPSLSREKAVMKAWEAHPELIAEYDAEYAR